MFCVSLIFIYTSYTANIVALLQSTSNSIRTLSDLLNSNMELGVDDTPYSRFYFSTATEPIRKKIYEKKIAPPNESPHYMNMSMGVSLVRKGLYAFHMELATGYKYVVETFYEHEKCGLVEIKYLQTTYPWQGMPKNSPYKEIFKVRLVREILRRIHSLYDVGFSFFKIRERGIQEAEKQRRYTPKPQCNSHVQSFGSVRFIDCYAAFLVFWYGIAAALLLLCIEIIFSKCEWLKKMFVDGSE